LLAQGRYGLRLSADAGLAALAPRLQLPQLNGALSGALHVDAALTGPFSTPDAAITMTGRDISAAGLQGITVDATGRVAGDSAGSAYRADLSTFTARVAGGTIAGRGQASLTAGTGAIRLDWRQLDLATTRTVLPDKGIQVAAGLEGALDAHGRRCVWMRYAFAARPG
jgi:autotransporter translocation and assembly factor TamB